MTDEELAKVPVSIGVRGAPVCCLCHKPCPVVTAGVVFHGTNWDGKPVRSPQRPICAGCLQLYGHGSAA